MKKTIAVIFSMLFLSYGYSQTVSLTFTTCGVKVFHFSHVDSTGRNAFACGSFVFRWQYNRWNISDTGSVSLINYAYNYFNSTPNPPCSGVGTWYISNLSCGFLINISGSCQQTVAGIESVLPENSISISPNPSSGKFTVTSSTQKNSLLEIYSPLGEKILEQIITSSETEINLTDNPSGIYFVRLKTDDGTVTRKIVLSK